jgi:hypothetical protein
MVTKPTGDGPVRLVALAVRILPPERADWARAMQAELASIGPQRDRWVFIGGCLRAIAAEQRMLRGVLHLLAVLGVVVVAFAWSATIGPPLTALLDVVVAVLAVVCWWARRTAMLGPVGDNAVAGLWRLVGYLVAGAIVLAGLAHLNPAGEPAADDGTAVLMVATTVAAYVVGLATVSARRSAATGRVVVTAVGCALAATAAWLVMVLVAPPVPSSPGASLALIVCGAAAAAALNAGGADGLRRGLLAAILAGAIGAGLVVILVDLLAHLAPPSMIPNIAIHALTPAARLAQSRVELVDPYIGVLVLGCVMAAAMGAISVATRRP